MRVAAVVLVAGVLSCVLIAEASPASAHTELVGSTPANGAELAASPTAVTLRFNEDMSAARVKTALTRGGDRVSAAAAPKTTAGNVTVPVSPALTPGQYKLAYRVISGDDHPVSGVIAFRVGQRAAPSSEVTIQTVVPDAGLQTGPGDSETGRTNRASDVDHGSDSGTPGTVWLIGALSAFVLIAALCAGLYARRGRRRRTP